MEDNKALIVITDQCHSSSRLEIFVITKFKRGQVENGRSSSLSPSTSSSIESGSFCARQSRRGSEARI